MTGTSGTFKTSIRFGSPSVAQPRSNREAPSLVSDVGATEGLEIVLSAVAAFSFSRASLCFDLPCLPSVAVAFKDPCRRG